METVRLSQIVRQLVPELYPFLKPSELDVRVVLRDGLSVLDPDGAFEIVEQSIYENQKERPLH